MTSTNTPTPAAGRAVPSRGLPGSRALPMPGSGPTRRRWRRGARSGAVALSAAALLIGLGGTAAGFPDAGAGPAHGGPSTAPATAGVRVVASPALATDIPRGAPLYVPPPDPGALQQITDLTNGGDPGDAALIARMIHTPQAVWLTGGTPAQVRATTSATVTAARRAHSIPTFVVYDVPGRDCSQYSAGGAKDTAAYRAWIDAVAAGIGETPAGVLVEPDGLANLPSDCGQDDAAGTLSAARIAQIRYAGARLGAAHHTAVYLDAGNSAWKAVGDITPRLIAAGVEQTNGFALNVSNYELNSHTEKYGTWVSACIAYTLHQAGADSANCASQYYPADPNDFSTWHLTDAWYAANVTVPATTHFVEDTSRNGVGPWTAPADHPAGDPEVWCNPPDRGLGATPTTDTGVPLLDARVWVKTPGQSDGQCFRWTTGPTDPVRDRVDPAAGGWFPDQALELARLARPALG